MSSDAVVGRSRRRTRSALVVVEIALAMILLVGAGLLLQSFVRRQRAELGFDPQNLFTMSLCLSFRDYPNAAARVQINTPSSLDVIFAGAGLTGTGGHPVEIVQRNVSRKIWTEADGEGGFYFTPDTLADLERKWPQIKAAHPDFIKTYLLYAEEYDKRKDDAAYFGWRGLNPTLLPEIVKRARREGLRVTTHVESAADFHYAVSAGVDEINHLPGFRPDRDNEQSYADLTRYEIKLADARAAARRSVFVVTPIGDLVAALNKFDANHPKKAFADKVKSLLVRNLRLLHQHKVRLALGSDS